MISELELYHGAALARLIHSEHELDLTLYPGPGNKAAYVVNRRVGLYIKHSRNRMSPWTFTFLRSHQDEIDEMKSVLEDVFIALVCNDDGIVCLSYDQLRQVADGEHGDDEWVRAARRPREMYTVTGSDGRLSSKVGENEYPAKILDAINAVKIRFR